MGMHSLSLFVQIARTPALADKLPGLEKATVEALAGSGDALTAQFARMSLEKL